MNLIWIMNLQKKVLNILCIEILQHAVYVGMELSDKDLLWIAKASLKAPLPAPWITNVTNDNEVCFYNTETNETIWEHPCDKDYKKLYIQEKEKKKIKELTENVLKNEIEVIIIYEYRNLIRRMKRN